MWLAQVLCVVVALPLAQNLWALSPKDYAVAAGFALGPMTLGIAFHVAGSALISAALTALIGVPEGPVGGLWVWAVLGEAPATATIIGGAVVLAAVVIRILLERERAA